MYNLQQPTMAPLNYCHGPQVENHWSTVSIVKSSKEPCGVCFSMVSLRLNSKEMALWITI